MQRPRDARQAQIALSNPLHTRHTSPGCRRIQCHGRRLDTRLVSIPASPRSPRRPRRPRPKPFLLEACRNQHGGAAPEGDYIVPPYGPCICDTPSSHADPLPTARHQPRGGEVTGTGWPLSASLISANYNRCTCCVHRRRLLRAARHRHASPSGISTRPPTQAHSQCKCIKLCQLATLPWTCPSGCAPVCANLRQSAPGVLSSPFRPLHFTSGNRLCTLSVYFPLRPPARSHSDLPTTRPCGLPGLPGLPAETPT
jgi:hypothetical protein